MRVVLLVGMFVSFIFFPDLARAQVVTLSFNLQNVPLADVLDRIEAASGYRFFYNADQVRPDARVSLVTEKGTSLPGVLTALFSGTKVSWQIRDDHVIVLSLITGPPPSYHVTGKITGSDGLPVGGVTVRLKGGHDITMSHPDGKFTVDVLPGATLLFTCVGFLQVEWRVDAAQKNIVLPADSRFLSEVVVIGFGTQKTITKTGAISSIKQEDIISTPSASMQNMLTGKLTGFFSQQRSGMPGKDGAEFVVRGVSTFTGVTTPLVLVDDVAFSYELFSTIDPNEVEAVTVLKDASTTAIYGIKGANGVVLVTTKRGKGGPPKINFRTEYGIQVPTHTPRFLNAFQTAKLRNESIANDNLLSGTATPPEFSAADLELFRNGGDPYGHPDVDWYHTLFRKSAPMTSTRLDISGGTERLRYFISGGYLNQQGMLNELSVSPEINNEYYYNRYNFRANLDISASGSLLIKADASGSSGLRNNPYFDGASGAGEVAAFNELFRYDFLNPYTYAIRNPDGTFGWSPPFRPAPFSAKPNIVGRIGYGGYTRVQENTINLNLSATQKLDALLPGLLATVKISALNVSSAQRQLVRRNFPSWYYDQANDLYTPRDAAVSRVDPWQLIYNAGSPSRQFNFQVNTAFSRQYGKHNFGALALFNQTTVSRADANASNNYIPANFRGVTFRGTYDYDERYLLEFSGAYNGSSRFVGSRRLGFFPAMAIGWNIARESFFHDNFTFVDLFKIRGSLGLTGSDDPGTGNYYIYDQTYVRNGTYSFGESGKTYSGIAEGSIGNEEVTWQKERKADMGLDVSLFHGSLSATFEWFSNMRFNILTPRNTIAPYFGLSSIPPVNIGKVANRGMELEINLSKRTGKFGFEVQGIYSHARNQILEIDEPQAKYPWQQLTGNSVGMVQQWIFDGFYTQKEIDDPNVAKPAGLVGTGFLKYRDLNTDGKIDLDDRAYIGNSDLPADRLGLNLGFTYRKLSFRILLQADLNFDFQLSQDISSPWKANLQEFHLQRWTPETAGNARFPRLVSDFVGTYMTSADPSTFWVIPGDYLRVRSVEAGWQIPPALLRKVRLKQARLFANGYNLFSWSRSFSRYQVDPEVARGSVTGTYPQQRLFNTGIAIQL
ncbi:TonB-dependent receptor [Hufsiella ginkgonis]|uniref:SusC/RagA family TonB-linked outer membrane protein n=1 Tax=Hufsiella ginkgonis TaxID=2695274 RepID=A0A7K1XSP5_9SPHI|nr:TonB-dependent receptor [Hufsiella ginkgonis]MXV13769.1 SusC/RagA family TonB-linked outer membrane protein [Hufsiella ginkgonis]